MRIPSGLLVYLDAVAKREHRSRAQEIVKRLVESSEGEFHVGKGVVVDRGPVGSYVSSDGGGVSVAKPSVGRSVSKVLDPHPAARKQVIFPPGIPSPAVPMLDSCPHPFRNRDLCIKFKGGCT